MTVSFEVEDMRWDSLALDELVNASVMAALSGALGSVHVLFTSDAEIQNLNRDFRGKDKPTNVLSFPSPPMPLPPGEEAHLGDLALAFETVEREALEQNKEVAHHVGHLIVHGVLHLLGYDHETDAEAEAMEAREAAVLATLGIANPYVT